jgi:hypothetical protein
LCSQFLETKVWFSTGGESCGNVFVAWDVVIFNELKLVDIQIEKLDHTDDIGSDILDAYVVTIVFESEMV